MKLGKQKKTGPGIITITILALIYLVHELLPFHIAWEQEGQAMHIVLKALDLHTRILALVQVNMVDMVNVQAEHQLEYF